MRKFFLTSLIFFLTLQFSCASGANIEGQVLDSQNNPIEGAEVRFVAYEITSERLTNKVKSESKTNKNGEFELVVEKSKDSEKLGIVIIKEGYKTIPITFTMEEVRKYSNIFKDYKIYLEKNNEQLF